MWWLRFFRRHEELGWQCDVLDGSRSRAAHDRRGARNGRTGGHSQTARDAPLIQSRCRHARRPSFYRAPRSDRRSRSTDRRRGSRHPLRQARERACPIWAGHPELCVAASHLRRRRDRSATHGSGVRNQSLAASVAALELVCADGSPMRLARTDDDFDGAVVALGALGLVVRVTLDVVPEFELRQQVFEGLPWATVEHTSMRCSTSVTAQASSRAGHEAGIDQVWVKSMDPIDLVFRRDGRGRSAPPDRRRKSGKRHRTAWRGGPVGGPAAALPPRLHTEQRRRAPVRVRDRTRHAVEAVRALRPLGRSSRPLLLTSEIRAVARTGSGSSPFHRARQRVHPLHLEAARPEGSSGAATDRSRPRAVRAEAALGKGIHPVAHAVLPRDYRRFARSAPASTPIGSLATRSTLSSGRSRTCPGSGRRARPRRDRDRRWSRCRPSRARSRRARMFSRIRAGVTDFGKTMLLALDMPPQDDLRRRSADLLRDRGGGGSSSTSPWAIGDHASVAIPWALGRTAATSRFWQYGWSSI